MQLSFSTSTDERRMTDFQVVDCRTLGETRRYILSHAWSPIVWQGNYRAEKNFLHSDFCALDFDDGTWTIADARTMLEKNDLAGIVGITKSHQIAKGKHQAVDRFRIVMPWMERIADVKTYKQNMERLTKHMPADRAAKDAARFFWPCLDVVFYRPGGKLSWLPYTPPVKRPLPPQTVKDAMLMPPGFYAALKTRAIEGNRNSLAYWAAKRMKEHGFRSGDVVDVLKSYIALDDNELKRTVSSAFKNSS